MKYFLLASGSSGNCSALLNDENEILLIDCGISINLIKQRLQQVGLSFEQIKKVLITHTHTDHIKSLKAFKDEDIYIHEATQMNDYHLFNYYEQLHLLGFDILVLPSSHDSIGTSGFLISYQNEKMAYITDCGYIHENVLRLINNCEYYCIESNHDPRLLMLTKRPLYLKNRILSANGHLSNQDCAYALGQVISTKTKEIVFLHRSKEANSEDILIQTFKDIMSQMKQDISNIRFAIAKQDQVITQSDLVYLSKLEVHQ